MGASVTGTRAAAFTSAAMIAHQVAGKAARDALFLTSFSASALPGVMAVAALLSLVAALWISRLLARFSPAAVLPIVFGVSMVGLVGEWIVGQFSPAAMAIAIYLHLAVFGPLLMTAFWSLINERFDPHSARRAIGRIATGGTIGGVLGALMAWRVAAIIELSTVVLLLAALHGACLFGSLRLRATAPRIKGAAREAELEDREQVSAVGMLRGEPYLRNLALLVALGSAMSSVLDYLFSFQAAATFDKGASLLSFFSLFWLAVAVLSLVMQLTVGERAVEKLGVSVNLAILPGLIIMGGVVGLSVPGFLSMSLLRGVEAVQRNTIYRSAYEMLYTPLSDRQKRSIKAQIDIGFDRAGTIVASALIVLFLALFASDSATYLLGAVLVLAVLTLAVVWRLHDGYVTALEHNLRDGATELELPSLARHGTDSEESAENVEREKLIQRAELLRPGHDSSTLSVDGTGGAALGPARKALDQPSALLDGRALLAGDVEAITTKLRAMPLEMTSPLSGFVILLLAHKQLHAAALEALCRAAPIMTGQLIDALVDPAMDFVVRRRIPYALAASASQRAADGLLLGIGDDRFEVRYACGRALMTIAEANPSIVISRQKIVQAILIEVDLEAAQEFEADPSGIDDASALVDDLLARDRVDRTLEHVFTILGLHLEREPMRMAYRALRHADVRHRGTALEYLQTILPHDIRDAVWPLVGALAPLPAARSAREILADLLRATVSARTSGEYPAISRTRTPTS